MYRFVANSRNHLRRVGSLLLLAGLLATLFPPSGALGWCFEGDGSVHVEPLDMRALCADNVAAERGVMPPWTPQETRLRSASVAQCADCVDIAIGPTAMRLADTVGPGLSGPQPSALDTLLPADELRLPDAAVQARRSVRSALLSTGILVRPTVVLLI